jgi:energy-coupling factor transporter ATP-binding protein EcfA2
MDFYTRSLVELMTDELSEFYDKAGTQKRSTPTAKPRGGASANHLENPGNIVTSAGAEGESRWSEADGLFWRAKKTHPIIPAGLYDCVSVDGIGPALRKKDLNTDSLLVLPEKNSEEIYAEFEKFWTLEDVFKKFGFLYKRGFLLWGPPGSGKTSLINLMMKTIIQRYNGIIVMVEDPDLAGGCLGMVRKNEPNRPLITIMEDLDALVERWGEAGYLALLDGSEQINNVIHIGTTNYPERLDKRFVDRPSRFDTVKKIGMPGWEARDAYFRHVLDDMGVEWWTEDALEKWIKQSRGFSVAHMREMIISVCCLGKNIDDVVERLEKMHERQPTSERDPDAPPMGIVAPSHPSVQPERRQKTGFQT